MPANGDGARPLRAQAVVVIGRRQRRLGVHLEKDAAAFARRIVDARQALLDQIARLSRRAASCLAMSPMPAHHVSVLRWLINRWCCSAARQIAAFHIAWSPATFRDIHLPCIARNSRARPQPHVADRRRHTARRRRDQRGRRRRLDRARRRRGREAHPGAGSAGREASRHHADLLSRLGRAAHHRRYHRGGRRKLRRRGRIRAAAARRPAVGRHRLRSHRPRGREIRRHGLQADVRQADGADVLGVRRGRAALGPAAAALVSGRERQARALPGWLGGRDDRSARSDQAHARRTAACPKAR